MKTMNHKSVLVLLAILACCFSLSAQSLIDPYGFAGEDKDEFFIPTPEQPYKTLTIGKSAYEVDGVSYFWEDVSYPDNPDNYPVFAAPQNKPQTKVNIWRPGIYTYQVCRVSVYGYQYERVSIRVIDKVTVVEATPKYDCWKEGEEINIGDFEIKTDPMGCNEYVILAEDSRVADNSHLTLFFDESKMQIHFMVYENGLGQDAVLSPYDQCYIKVVDELSAPGYNTPDLTKVKEIGESFKKIATFVNVAGDIGKYLDKFPEGLYNITDDVTLQVEVSYHEDCCGHNPAAYVTIGLTGGVVCGITLYGPIIPGIFLSGGFEAGIKANVTLHLSLPGDKSCHDLEVHIPGYIEASVGLTAGVPGALDVTGSLVIGGSLEYYWTYLNGHDFQLDFYFKLRAQITTPLGNFTWEWDPFETVGQ